MALPGLSLPGLNLSNPAEEPSEAAEVVTRYHNLQKETEYRFESSFAHPITIKVVTGNAEYFGSELATNTPYTFRGAKGAIFSWQGAYLEVSGEPEADYVAEETPMVQYANLHFALENMREESKRRGAIGPRVLVVGPEDAGKTSLVKMLTSYAVKMGRQPMVVNLDPQEGLLSPPGSFTATSFGSILDVEEGWGSSPISGPTALPVQMPLCYQFGCRNPTDNEKIFKPLVTRMALAVTSRLEEDADVKETGCFIDTAGSMSSTKGGGYDLIQHIISEFSINVILALGSEKLSNDMRRRFSNSNGEEPVAVVKLDKSGGCVDRDQTFMKHFRQAQIREYFFGRGGVTLSPHSQLIDFSQIAIYKIVDRMFAALNHESELTDGSFPVRSASRLGRWR
jgi:polyribonucleotide 5'-hydroxyl-kinase